jgi:hypothetical protein
MSGSFCCLPGKNYKRKQNMSDIRWGLRLPACPFFS